MGVEKIPGRRRQRWTMWIGCGVRLRALRRGVGLAIGLEISQGRLGSRGAPGRQETSGGEINRGISQDRAGSRDNEASRGKASKARDNRLGRAGSRGKGIRLGRAAASVEDRRLSTADSLAAISPMGTCVAEAGAPMRTSMSIPADSAIALRGVR